MSDLVFEISGGAAPGMSSGRMPKIERAVEKDKKVAWCKATAQFYKSGTILVIKVTVKVVSDYKPKSVKADVRKKLWSFAVDPDIFLKTRPGMITG